MKLVLQIAAGILLASVVAASSVALYRWLSATVAAEAQDRAESKASDELRGLTIDQVKASCAPVIREEKVEGLPGWRTIVFAGVSATLEPLDGGFYNVAWVRTPFGSSATTGLDRLHLLPCLERAKSEPK